MNDMKNVIQGILLMHNNTTAKVITNIQLAKSLANESLFAYGDKLINENSRN